MGHSTNGAKHLIAIQERRTKVLELRKAGTQIRTIAAIVGVSHVQVLKDLQYCYTQLAREQRATTEQVRSLQLSRLEMLLGSVWGDAIKGDVASVRTAAALIEQISRLHGLPQVAPLSPMGDTLPNVQPILQVLLQIFDGRPEDQYRAAAMFAELEATATEVEP